jgi:hypothetical protein
MKKYLFLAFIFAFTLSLSAQSLSKKGLKKEATEVVSADKSKVDEQIKTALMKDEGLQEKAIGFLKTNPETAVALAGLASKKGTSTSMGLMKSILGDESLTAAAIGFISSNPELLRKAMSLVGM